MYRVNFKNVKGNRKEYQISLFIGIIFLVVISIMCYYTEARKSKFDSSVMSNKVVLDTSTEKGDTFYSKVYYYEVDGKTYKCNSIKKSTNKPNTKNEKVYYEKDNPTNCMSESSKTTSKWMPLFLILPISFIIFSIFGFIKVNKQVKRVKYLCKNGKLVKNLPYTLEATETVINNKRLMRPVVNYILPNGNTVVLRGNNMYAEEANNNRMIDLIIDANDPTNYYLDFSINRLSGNLTTDYYNNQETNNQNISNYDGSYNPSNKF